MAGAALDHLQIGIGDQAQHLGRLLAHVLRPRMAGDVQRDAAVERLAGPAPGLRCRRCRPHIREMSKVASASVFTFASSGRISGHSNFSISAQDGTSATTS